MSLYCVQVMEVHYRLVYVDAEDKDEARLLVANGKGEKGKSCLEYSKTLPPSEWDIWVTVK